MRATRVLFLTCHLPFPPYSGGRRREYELLVRLAGRFEIELCVVTKTPEEDSVNRHILEGLCREVHIFPAQAADPSCLGRYEEGPRQVVSHRCSIPHVLQRHIASRIRSERPIDLIHVEGFYLMQHLPDRCSVPILLTEQNVEYELWRQRVEVADKQLRRERLTKQYLLTVEAERSAWQQADMCVALTAEDRATMISHLPQLEVRIVPDGNDHRSAVMAVAEGNDRLDDLLPGSQLMTMVGNFAYEPNHDAGIYICREIAPRLKELCPAAQFMLVGNAPSKKLRQAAAELPNVHITGRVPAVEPFLAAADVVVCPLRIGGGVKVKMLEALSHGSAIVTTPVGIQGFERGIASVVEVADGPENFADSVAGLLASPALRSDLKQRAKRFSASLPTWDYAADRLAECYRKLAKSEAGHRLQKAS